MAGEAVTLTCTACRVRITGTLKRDGKVYAARWPRPGRSITGLCSFCSTKGAHDTGKRRA